MIEKKNHSYRELEVKLKWFNWRWIGFLNSNIRSFKTTYKDYCSNLFACSSVMIQTHTLIKRLSFSCFSFLKAGREKGGGWVWSEESTSEESTEQAFEDLNYLLWRVIVKLKLKDTVWSPSQKKNWKSKTCVHQCLINQIIARVWKALVSCHWWAKAYL